MKYLVNGLEIHPLLCSIQHFISDLDEDREYIENLKMSQKWEI